MNNFEPPIRDMSPREVLNIINDFIQKYEKIWEDKEKSLKSSLIKVINKIENCQQKEEALGILNLPSSQDHYINDDDYYKKKFDDARSKFAMI